jgi:hypothetical protein
MTDALALADTLVGSCFCGSVRYTCRPPLPMYSCLCHCTTCRRTCGGVRGVAWITVPAAGFRIHGPTLATLRSSERVTRQFCSACGAHLTYARGSGEDCEEDGEDTVDVTVSSLDEPHVRREDVVPTHHIWMSDALPWDIPTDGLPCFQRRRVSAE